MIDESISILNELIQITKDSEEGFCTAANNIDDEYLEEIFQDKADNCESAIYDLQTEVSNLNGEYEEGGTLLGAVHRGWVNIKGALTGKDPHAILVECEKGEDVIKAAYMKALQNNLDESVRPLVQSIYEKVVKDHDIIRDLRDKYASLQ
jgi:uncharacterized protein (TIGR02284 family)